MTILPIDDAIRLAAAAFEAADASPAMAASTALALVAAEIDGQAGHGLSRVPSYAAQLRSGKADGKAVPAVTRPRPATLRIDVGNGFAYPALDSVVESLPALANEFGVAAAGLFRSHHIGQAGRVAERLAEAGTIALVLSNTPPAMALPGGTKPMLGTNPLAFAAPMTGREPLVIDLSLSQVPRARIVAAAKNGQMLQAGWANDAEGHPTTDARAALAGTLAPIGGAKGAVLAVMVEILCAALAGGRFGWQATSFFEAEGDPAAIGQMIVAFAPPAFTGDGFAAGMRELAAAVVAEEGLRLPGDSRLERRRRARTNGVEIDDALAVLLEEAAR
jgi:(2R)-3-sulfolactate dehydrogenase (NADP+)